MRFFAALAALALAGCSLTVPLQPSRPEHQTFTAPTRPGVDLTVVPLRTGGQHAPRCAPAGEASCLDQVEIVHAAYLVKHPRATFLIESGLSQKNRDDLEKFSPYERAIFEYVPQGGLKNALLGAGHPRPSFVLITHAHWDHTGGLLDLRHPRVILGPGEAEFVKNFPADKPPTVMPHHLAGATLSTFPWDGPAFENFPSSHDLFGDGSVVLVPLPGHTPGSVGVFLSQVKGRRLLFVGDATWTDDGFRLPSHKLAPLSKTTDDDPARLSETIWRIHHLQRHDPGLLVVPTHSGAAFRAVASLVGAPAD